MENKISPEQPEQSGKDSKVTAQSSRFNRLLLPVFIVVILTLGSIIIFLFQRSRQSALNITPTPEISETIKPTFVNSDTSVWKEYTNDEAGFTLKYPASVLFEAEIKGVTQPILFVSAEKLSSIPEDLPQLMGRKDALIQKESLKTGGENVVKIGFLNGELGMTLIQFEICSVTFSRSLTFYPGDYRVIISLAGPKEEVMNSMPDFFTVDKTNCGDKRIWNQDKIGTFEQTLAQKKGKGAAQEWYDTFDAIIKTITLTTPKNTAAATKTVPSDWLTYKNVTNGFEISYPKSYKALDSKTDLYSYPQGVVLIYGGGQAYDVVVEIWNTEAEYKNKYATRMSDVTVVKYKDKFITLLDNTSTQENKEIISLFKLSP